MIRENLNYIEKIFDKNEKFSLIIYFIFSIIISILETIGIGIIPGFFSVLINKNIVINKLDFNEDLTDVSTLNRLCGFQREDQTLADLEA